MDLLVGTVPANNLLLAGTVPANKFLLARSPPGPLWRHLMEDVINVEDYANTS